MAVIDTDDYFPLNFHLFRVVVFLFFFCLWCHVGVEIEDVETIEMATLHTLFQLRYACYHTLDTKMLLNNESIASFLINKHKNPGSSKLESYGGTYLFKTISI